MHITRHKGLIKGGIGDMSLLPAQVFSANFIKKLELKKLELKKDRPVENGMERGKR